MTPLAELSAQGVAVWLDDLSRELLASGELQLLITGRHVVGVTTNPTIFASARSAASFFISRVDTEVDTRLDQIATPQATELKGKAAIANARLACQAYEEVIASQRWQQLAGLGARPQRPLWASTGIKNPAYPDTMYVTELVAAGTVNTMPGTTLAAFADHGEATGNTITGRYHDARRVLDQLATAGIDFDNVTGQLEREGLAKFENSWNELSHTIAAELHRNHPARQP